MGKVFVQAHEVKSPARFLDARFHLMDEQAGQTQYNEGHIEGTIYVHLEKDMSAMDKVASGRHPMPDKEQLVDFIERNGLSNEDTIYIYDNGAEPFASRVYYMLTYAGLDHVYIVNGGFQALVKAGFKVTTDVPTFDRTNFIPDWKEDIYADRAFVRNIVDGNAPNTMLLDARAAIRYSGEHEPLDPIAGHIPTAENFDWEQLKEDTYLGVPEKLLQTVPQDKEVVVYCGSGVTASPLYTVLKEAGYESVRVYVGSYSDWINEYEVETK